jgi:hypothetical protein
MMDKKKTNANKTVRLSHVTEFRPEKPVMFDPPKLMFVWDEDDVVEGDNGAAPYFASVIYVNPRMVGHGVLAEGDGASAKNFGTTWDHCALIEECNKAPSFGSTLGKRDNSDPRYRSIDHIPLAVYEYLQSSDACHVSHDEIVTHRELSQWVGEGKGEVLYCKRGESDVFPQYSNSFKYRAERENLPVVWARTVCGEDLYVMVRKYGDKQPSHPTYKYMGLAAEETPDIMPVPEKKMATLSNVVYWICDRIRPLGFSVAYGDSEVLIQGTAECNDKSLNLCPMLCEFLPKVANGTMELTDREYIPQEDDTGVLVYNPSMDMDTYIRTMDRIFFIEHLIVRMTGLGKENLGKYRFPVEIADSLCKAFPYLREHYHELIRTPDWNDYTK